MYAIILKNKHYFSMSDDMLVVFFFEIMYAINLKNKHHSSMSDGMIVVSAIFSGGKFWDQNMCCAITKRLHISLMIKNM
jgi:hypothetical protein